MNFSNVNNIREWLEYRVPRQSANVIKEVSKQADFLGQRLYLVGGSLRDIFLNQKITDLDFTINADPLDLANSLPEKLDAKLISKSQFGTIKLEVHNHTIDIAQTRTESYLEPGALPSVSIGSIEEDLARRDFSINSMAVSLSNSDWGNILDPNHGRIDLGNKLIRILHPNSFKDDPTRILRAIRYEQRLGFKIERKTEQELIEGIQFIHTISGKRLRSEFEYIFDETSALKILSRGRSLGILNAISSGFCCFDIKKIHKISRKVPQNVNGLINLAFITYYLTSKESTQFVKKLSMPKSWMRIVKDTISLRSMIPELSINNLKASSVFKYLSEHCYEAILANKLLTESEIAKKRMDNYINVLQYIKPELSGLELQEIGVPQGPLINQFLSEILVEKLDGKIKSKRQEQELIKQKLFNTRPFQ